jgi:hypothetical protein
MNSDMLWQNLRYLLISLGSSLVTQYGLGKFIDSAAIEAIAGLIVGLLMLFGGWAWGVYVKWRTKSVTEKTAAREDVKTVSGATGEVRR